LSRIWSWWAESWRSPARARALYVIMTLGFAGLAVGGAVKGDALVAVVASVAAVVTALLAVLAPKLAQWTRGSTDVR
jgi:hypothetical protein